MVFCFLKYRPAEDFDFRAQNNESLTNVLISIVLDGALIPGTIVYFLLFSKYSFKKHFSKSRVGRCKRGIENRIWITPR